MTPLFLIRFGFASLSSFEFLNSIKVLKFPLHFPWIALTLLSLSIWLFWEKFIKRGSDLPGLIGGLFLFQLYADTLENVFKLYTKFQWFDRLTHFTGGIVLGATAFLTLANLKRKKGWQFDYKFLIISAITLALFFGVLYEFFEFFMTYILKYNMITDRFDTDRDLLFDFIGTSLVVSLLSYLKKSELAPA